MQETKESAKQRAAQATKEAKGAAGELVQRAQETKESAKEKTAQTAEVRFATRPAAQPVSPACIAVSCFLLGGVQHVAGIRSAFSHTSCHA